MSADPVCAGLFGPCAAVVVHEMSDPEGLRPPVYLCQEHWRWSEELIAKLGADSKLRERFEQALGEAERGKDPLQ